MTMMMTWRKTHEIYLFLFSLIGSIGRSGDSVRRRRRGECIGSDKKQHFVFGSDGFAGEETRMQFLDAMPPIESNGLFLTKFSLLLSNALNGTVLSESAFIHCQ